MQLTFDRRIGVAGVIVAFLGVGVTILWPDAKWLGWLCVLIGVVGLAAWILAEVRIVFGSTQHGRGLTTVIAVLTLLSVVFGLWKAVRPLSDPLHSHSRTTSTPAPAVQHFSNPISSHTQTSSPPAPAVSETPSVVRGKQKPDGRVSRPQRKSESLPLQSGAKPAPITSDPHVVTVTERVKHIVTIQLQISPTYVTPDADIETALGGDPLDKQEILMNLETEYKINISDRDALTLHTVGDLIAYIQKRTGAP